MDSKIQLPALISSLATRVDGSITIKLETRELGGDEAAKLFSLRGSEAWVLIAPSEFKEVSIPSERPDPAIKSKTPSQALRDRLFVYFTHALNGVEAEFEGWYRRELDRIGQKYLDKVDRE